jgi:hypothetical protein
LNIATDLKVMHFSANTKPQSTCQPLIPPAYAQCLKLQGPSLFQRFDLELLLLVLWVDQPLKMPERG